MCVTVRVFMFVSYLHPDSHITHTRSEWLLLFSDSCHKLLASMTGFLTGLSRPVGFNYACMACPVGFGSCLSCQWALVRVCRGQWALFALQGKLFRKHGNWPEHYWYGVVKRVTVVIQMSSLCLSLSLLPSSSCVCCVTCVVTHLIAVIQLYLLCRQ